MTKEFVARHIGATITTSTQSAPQGNGQSPCIIKGKTKMKLQHDGKIFQFDALVVENSNADILAGIPFMLTNDISLRPVKSQILFNDRTNCTYNSANKLENSAHAFHHTNTYPPRAPSVTTTILPRDFIEVPISSELNKKVELAIELRYYKMSKAYNGWPTPKYITPVAGEIKM